MGLRTYYSKVWCGNGVNEHVKVLVKIQDCVSLTLWPGFCCLKFLFQRCAVQFSLKGKIIDCRKHYMMNLAIRLSQLQTGTGLLGPGRYMDLAMSGNPESLGLHDCRRRTPAVSRQSLSQCSDALRCCQTWRKNDSTGWHFLPLNCSKFSETELWDRKTLRKNFSVSQLFFLKTMGFHKSVHEAVTTYISIKIALSVIMQ